MVEKPGFKRVNPPGPMGSKPEFNLSKIKAIIFDLDGTLVDAYKPIVTSFNFTMRKLGLPAKSSLTIRKAVGWGDSQLLAPFVPRSKLAFALKIYRNSHKKTLTRQAKLFPGVKKLLSALSRRYILAVASNRPTQFSKILVKTLGIDKYFSFLLCADSLKKGKPSPQILQRIIRHFGIRAQEAIYVGDMAIDAQAAHRAKTKAIIVTTGSSKRQEIKREKPYRIISSIAQLDGLLKK